MTYWKIQDMKFEPWSDWTDFRRPTNVKQFIRALTMFLFLIFLSGMASGKRVGTHIIVRRHSWPDLVLGNAPTQSIIILLKDPQKHVLAVNELLVLSGAFSYHLANMARLTNRREGNDQKSTQLPNTVRPRHQRERRTYLKQGHKNQNTKSKKAKMIVSFQKTSTLVIWFWRVMTGHWLIVT